MNLEAMINQHYDILNENDLYILNYILNNRKECERLSITQLSKRCNSSASSIMRLAQKLGFSGFTELKYFLKNDNLAEVKQVINETDQYRTFDQFKKSLENTIKFFENMNLDPIYEKIKNTNHVYIYGTGWAQQLAGEQLVRLFSSCNRPMILIKHDTEFNMLMNRFTKDDLVIIISLSGNIDHITESLRILKITEIPTISITDFKNNQLASLATYNLYYQSSILQNQQIHGKIDVTSMGSLQVLCELIFIGYMDKYGNGKPPEEFTSKEFKRM